MKRLVILLALVPALALAHAVTHPRQLLVRATPDALELRFGYELGAAEAPAVRRLFDRDRDGVLSAAEREKLGVYLEARAVGSFELRRDGKAAPPETSTRQVSGADRQRGSLSVVVHQAWKLATGAHAFTVWDEGDSMGHLPVRLQSDGVRLRFGGVKLGAAYDLPARTEVTLSVKPAK